MAGELNRHEFFYQKYELVYQFFFNERFILLINI